MNYKVLYRKYRPDSFENIIGQNFIIKTLKNSISNQKISHAYIFTGPKGTGKTSTAKVFAKVVNCLDRKEYKACEKCFNCLNSNDNPDVIEIDAASNNGVDEIRELRNNVKISPNNSNYKIYIIDEVHMLSTEAFNALLKTLEEPPQHVIFILATTDIQKVPLTILSRCQRFDFKKISVEDMNKRIKEIALLEKIKIDNEAINEISYITDGSFRDALSLLDQLNIGEKIDLLAVTKVSGSVSNKQLTDLYEALSNYDGTKTSKIINDISNTGANYKFFVEKFVDLLKNKAVDIVNKQVDENIDYITLKKIIFELVKSLNITKSTSNQFLIAELIILEPILKKNKENKTINKEEIISREIISVNKKEEKQVKKVEKVKKEANNVKKDEKTGGIISREIISEQKSKNKNDNEVQENKTKLNQTDKEKDSEEFNKFKKIRVNNCFVNASKEKLNKVSSNWKKFLDNIKLNNQEICSLLIDSKVVTACNNYAIIEVDSDAQSVLLNKNLTSIEKMFADNNYKIIFLTKKEWEKEKEKYIKNKKSNNEYKLKEEIILKEKTKKSKIESIALEIFDNNKIVIK